MSLLVSNTKNCAECYNALTLTSDPLFSERPVTSYRRSARDVMCGLLHCDYVDDSLELGQGSPAINSASYRGRRDNWLCRTAIVDFGLRQLGIQQGQSTKTPQGVVGAVVVRQIFFILFLNM